MKRLATLTAITLCLLVTSIDITRAQTPNILLVVADDLGVDSVSTYGEGTAPGPTPGLDALAANGVLFRNAWSNPSCSPTRASLLTGRYPFRHTVGSPQGTMGLPLVETTIPETLDAMQTGYASALIGKWHLAHSTNGGQNSVNMAGFHHFTGTTGGGLPSYFNWNRNENGVVAPVTGYATTRVVDDAIAWINLQTASWFCMVSFNAPHSPFHAPPVNLHSQSFTGLNPNQTRRAHYRAMVEAMDTEMSRLLASVSTTNTVVIFVGDNGTPAQTSVAPFLPGHAKGTLYEGGVNVPLIVSGPNVVAPGREVDTLVSTTDLFATIVELADASAAPFVIPSDSQSIVSYLEDPVQTPIRDVVYAESFQSTPAGPQPETTGGAAARGNRYKLIRLFDALGSIDEFYDLTVDPFETNDLLLGTLTPTENTARLLLAATIDDLRHPSGLFTNYGTATCTTSSGTPTITGNGMPIVGGTYTVALQSAPPNAAATLIAGASDKLWNALTLPLALEPIGTVAGCRLYTSVDFTFPAATTASGTASMSITIPNDPLLIGARAYHQWLIADVMSTASVPLVLSDGLIVDVGE